MDNNNLIEINKLKLRKIFSTHDISKTGTMSVNEFTKFCKNSKIFPDLLTILEIKKILKNSGSTHMVTYYQFETVIKAIATTAFTEALSLSDKVKILFMHIRNPCKLHY